MPRLPFLLLLAPLLLARYLRARYPRTGYCIVTEHICTACREAGRGCFHRTSRMPNWMPPEITTKVDIAMR